MNDSYDYDGNDPVITIYGFNHKIKFIKFLRAISPHFSNSDSTIGLKAAKAIADDVEKGFHLKLYVTDKNVKNIIRGYASEAGAILFPTEQKVIDFYEAVNYPTDGRF